MRMLVVCARRENAGDVCVYLDHCTIQAVYQQSEHNMRARGRKALEEETPEQVLQGKDLALMRYAGKLTKTPGEMVAEDVLFAKREGASDEEILEVNQVCAYFNYSNRTLNGLGVSTEGDIIGYYQK